MKPSDIIVGRQYVHEKHPNAIYLGVGRGVYKNLYDEFPISHKDKNLVVISGDGFVGTIVITPNDKNSFQGFWDGFKLKKTNKQPRNSNGRFTSKN